MSFNCITARRKSGACTELKGEIGLYCVFVDEPGHSWDGNEKAELRKNRKAVSDLIIAEAAKDGAGVRFTNFEDSLASSVPITNDNWKALQNMLAGKHGFSSMDDYNESVRKKHSLACSAILFFIDNDDRSFASSCNYENRPSRSAECAVVFGANQGTILHELLHLFGAADLYYPDKVNDLSSKLFPNSVMRGSGNLVIDDLTRYLIGWRSSLTPDAKRIVDIGVFPSKDAFYKELDKQWVSKAYAVQKGDNGTYYGPLRRGLYNGKGKYVHNSGAVYEGDFVSGTFTGKGKLTYSNGSVYEGEFRNWKCVGHGKLTFSDGSYYEGEFSGGPYPVRGRLRYSTGRVYEGEFDGSGNPVEKRSRGSSAEQKRLTLSDGSIYDGVHPHVNPQHSTAYTVTVTDAIGCTATASGFITVREGTFPEPLHAWCEPCEIVAYHETTLHATNYGSYYTYQWTPSQQMETPYLPNTVVTPDTTMTYTVTVTDTFGCQRTDTVTVKVNPIVCDMPFVFIPNSFTPNGDGRNDVLYVRSDILVDCHFIVYNRWGEKVFETFNQEIGWDGTFKGKECPRATYDWYFKGTCKDGDEAEMKGNVTLIR